MTRAGKNITLQENEIQPNDVRGLQPCSGVAMKTIDDILMERMERRLDKAWVNNSIGHTIPDRLAGTTIGVDLAPEGATDRTAAVAMDKNGRVKDLSFATIPAAAGKIRTKNPIHPPLDRETLDYITARNRKLCMLDKRIVDSDTPDDSIQKTYEANLVEVAKKRSEAYVLKNLEQKAAEKKREEDLHEQKIWRLARSLFETDPRVIAFAEERGEFTSNPNNVGKMYLMFATIWQRNENGWKDEAMVRARKMWEVLVEIKLNQGSIQGS